MGQTCGKRLRQLWLRLLLLAFVNHDLLGRLRRLAPDGGLLLYLDRLLVWERTAKHLLLRLLVDGRSHLLRHLQLQLLEELLLLMVELRMVLNLELRLFDHVV